MPQSGAVTFVAGDANTGAGYAKIPASSGEQKSNEIWPYKEITPAEEESLEYDPETEEERRQLAKKRGQYVPSDHIGQANYKPHAYVKSATRGLTGIMASVEPEDVLEHLVNEVGYTAAQGQAGRSYSMMGPYDARTRPGRRTGSKRGWFSSPIAKHTDPSERIRKYTLKDIVGKDEDDSEPILWTKLERERLTASERPHARVSEGADLLLRTCIRGMLADL